MTRGAKLALIIVGAVVVLLAAAFLVLKLYSDFAVRDKGGMENPDAGAEIRPAEGARLVSASLWNTGSSMDRNYFYDLWTEDGAEYFSCECTLEDGERLELEARETEPAVLEELNALALGFDLTETPPAETTYEILDGESGRVTFVWDDGTEVSPDRGFNETEEFFKTLVKELKGA